ncbi:MAG: hypothetical protein PHQ25_00425 [Acidobacteriota bacterium]|nr:hypothetical protein [Acidobacteriota bacterium]MDW3228391.1 hypothetical protein [Acidobacteriota bacterium]MDY0231213.1 hypothetical protein [Candidatus Saccharicenans sp.]
MGQGSELANDDKQRSRPFLVLLVLVVLWAFGGQGCARGPINFVSPDEIQNLAGQASCYARGPGKEGRFRLGFYGNVPDQVKLELFNPLGGVESILWLNGPEAILYLPGEKVFWQGHGQLITSDFFGTELETRELIQMLAARWAELEKQGGWKLLLDEEESVIAGEKGNLRFEIKERFSPGQIPRTIYFEAQGYMVRMRILKIKFNHLEAKSVFRPTLPPAVRELPWEEISARWNR